MDWIAYSKYDNHSRLESPSSSLILLFLLTHINPSHLHIFISFILLIKEMGWCFFHPQFSSKNVFSHKLFFVKNKRTKNKLCTKSYCTMHAWHVLIMKFSFDNLNPVVGLGAIDLHGVMFDIHIFPSFYLFVWGNYRIKSLWFFSVDFTWTCCSQWFGFLSLWLLEI